jgi:3-methyladenine DNA glycosylase/8-oxoguanine DNA glycosylase
MADALEIPLRGPKGEPVDFARTIASHGVAELRPNELSLEERTLVTTLPVGGSARTLRLTSADRKLRLEVVAGRVGARAREALSATVSHMFRLDEDLSAFYELVSDDAGLDWCTLGAGRMLRAPTVFEDVAKTICTLVRTAVRGSALACPAPSPA